YFVPTPTLFWIWTWSTVYDNTFWSWKDLLPWVNNVAIFDSSKVYATWSDNLWSAEINDLMTTVKAAYSTWNVTTPAVQAIVSASWSELINIWNWLVKNSLWGGNLSETNTVTSAAVPENNTWTILLLHGDNINNPAIFTDSSPFWKIVSTNGNAVQTSSWAWVFDWSTSYITTPNSTDFNFWTWDFTIDAYVNTKTNSSYQMIFDRYNATAYTWQFWINGWKLFVYIRNSAADGWVVNFTSSVTMSINDWHHVALTRSSWVFYLWLDWVQVGSVAANYNLNSTLPVTIWKQGNSNNYFFNWYLDELRVTKWLARWTGNFSSALPVWPLTADVNDILLIHFNWQSLADSAKWKILTTFWNTTQTSPKFWNWSISFNWNSSYLTVPSSADFNFWTWNFTIDSYIYTRTSSLQVIADRYDGTAYKWQFGINNWKLFVYVRNATSDAWIVNYNAETTISTNAWHHVALTRSSWVFYLWLDWVLDGSVAANYNLDSTLPLTIWKQGNWAYYFNWYLDELRISKWIARWDWNFTPPNSPY
ncbi:MAG: Gp88, partial [uncultured bacterium (gcode 4)]